MRIARYALLAVLRFQSRYVPVVMSKIMPHGMPTARPIVAHSESPEGCVMVRGGLCSVFVALVLGEAGAVGVLSDELVGCAEGSEGEFGVLDRAESESLDVDIRDAEAAVEEATLGATVPGAITTVVTYCVTCVVDGEPATAVLVPKIELLTCTVTARNISWKHVQPAKNLIQ